MATSVSLIVFYAFIFLIGITGNAVVIKLSLRRARHQRSRVLMLGLALSDIFGSIFNIFHTAMQISDMLNMEGFSCSMISIVNYLQSCTFLLSAYLISAMVLDRYYAINSINLRVRYGPPVRKLTQIVAFLAFLAVILAVPAAFAEPFTHVLRCFNSDWQQRLFYAHYIIPGLSNIGTLALISILHIKIFFIVRRRVALNSTNAQSTEAKCHSRPPNVTPPVLLNNVPTDLGTDGIGISFTNSKPNSVSYLNNLSCDIHTSRNPIHDDSESVQTYNNTHFTNGASQDFTLPGEVMPVNQSSLDPIGNQSGNRNQSSLNRNGIQSGYRNQSVLDHKGNPSGIQNKNELDPEENQSGNQNSNETIRKVGQSGNQNENEMGPTCDVPILSHVTKMLLLVTVVFFITRFPSMVLLGIWRSHIEPFEDTNMGLYGFLSVFRDLYVVAYAVDPFLYLFNASFRTECKTLFKRE